MSAIILSAILLLVAATAGFSGFYGRFNILDSEFKERSSALADACVDELLLLIANDAAYKDAKTVDLYTGTCQIFAATNPTGNPRTFTIQAVYQNSYTNLIVTIDVEGVAITSWQEVPNS